MSRPDEQFISEMRALEAAYLESDDPIVQSGFHGGRNRWVAERLPLVEAIDRDGDFLEWAAPTGFLSPTLFSGHQSAATRSCPLESIWVPS